MRIPSVARVYVVTGVVVGGVGTALFGVLHALLIVPIWRSLIGGLLFAIPAGIAVTWAFAELASPRTLRSGARFGLLLWAMLIPVTAITAFLRVSGLRESLGSVQAVLELGIVALTALSCGWLLRRNGRTAAVLSGAAALTVIAMRGPIAVSSGSVEVLLFAGFLPIYVVAGLLVATSLRAAEAGWTDLRARRALDGKEIIRYRTPSSLVMRNLRVLLFSVVITFFLLRTLLHASPDADLNILGYNIHHLFTGLLLIMVGGIPLAVFRGSTRRLDGSLVLFGAGLAMALDEWVYLIATDGSNAAYLLPISFWGGLVMVGVACFYGGALVALRVMRPEPIE